MASNLTQRRGHANKAHSHEHDHTDDEHDHSHSHSHGLFHSHSHSHGAEGASEIIRALSGAGDAGSRITLIGLASNVVLSAAKGVAGVYLNSAALVADAAHSLSDLMGDFVTLACWKISRRQPTDAYPYGYGKFETLGTTVVSLILVGGAAAIGLHSYTMLLDALSPTVTTMPQGPMHDFLQFLVGTKESVGDVLSHTHGHAHIDESAALDPNAAWFALASVIIKEWNYRTTKAVADEMKSPVLLANAYHHRSDAYSSLVTLLAIVGTWAMPTLPLDPLGGMLVSLLILQQGVSLCWTAFGDFTDAGVPLETRRELGSLVKPLLVSPAPHTLLGIRNVRAVKSGSLMFVDLTADVPAGMTVLDAHEVEKRVRDAIMESRTEVKEVRVHLHAVEEGQDAGNGKDKDNSPC
ncbi:Iron ion transporter [Ceratobasidium theobromae]|uniref:Iron ion transporter n=1 Tax=Ceratobasidium theobromae TaxID=1582974 RepID=A0A5N5QGE5_9AGAM|nr:Iron ion transporter [Ceratobasidium theobromae]